jgi:translation initiation factor IF-1
VNSQLFLPWRLQAAVIEGITQKMLKVKLADSDQKACRLGG